MNKGTPFLQNSEVAGSWVSSFAWKRPRNSVWYTIPMSTIIKIRNLDTSHWWGASAINDAVTSPSYLFKNRIKGAWSQIYKKKKTQMQKKKCIADSYFNFFENIVQHGCNMYNTDVTYFRDLAIPEIHLQKFQCKVFASPEFQYSWKLIRQYYSACLIQWHDVQRI